VQIGEIAAPAAGDENLPPRLPIMFKQRHATATLPGNCGAHQPCRARSQNNYVELARFGGHCSHSE
jgi:hypothetical protein